MLRFQGIITHSVTVFSVFSLRWRSGFPKWILQHSIISYCISVSSKLQLIVVLSWQRCCILCSSTCTLWHTDGKFKMCFLSSLLKQWQCVYPLLEHLNPFTELSLTLLAFCQKFHFVSHKSNNSSDSCYNGNNLFRHCSVSCISQVDRKFCKIRTLMCNFRPNRCNHYLKQILSQSLALKPQRSTYLAKHRTCSWYSLTL